MAKALETIKDFHTRETVYSYYQTGDLPSGALKDADGNPVDTYTNVWVDGKEGGVLKALFDKDNKPVPMYTDDWKTNSLYIAGRMGDAEQAHAGGQEYPGGRPTELDYVAGMDTVNPPQPEPEQPEPEQPEPEQPEPEQPEGPEVPAGAVFDEYDLLESMGDEAPELEVARAAVRAATDLVDTYTRGAAYRRIRVPRPGVNSVVHTVAARIAANPGFISRRDQAGNFSRSLGQGFTGFTLTERTVLNEYRRTAR